MKKMLKSGLLLLLAFLMVYSILPPLKAAAGGLILTLESGHYVITGYTGGSGGVDIPETSGIYPITEIADNAFENCTGITSVHCSNNITYIGANAFLGCTGLKLVDLKKAFKSGSAFNGCTNLQEIKVDSNSAYYRVVDGILYSKNYPFIDLYPKGRQGKYDIPNGVTCINDYAFQGCLGLTEVSIPSSVMSVGEQAFNGCQNLASAFFKGHAPSMGSAVFDGCKSGFVIRYFSGKPGFTNPWHGYPTEAVSEAFTVAFNLNGTAGTPPATQKVNKDALAVKPADPARSGYTFGGWYPNAACTGSAWNFNTPVTANMTLYAKWNAAPSAYLAVLKVSAGKLSPVFKPKVYKYTINLGENEKKVTVTPQKAYSGAAMTIDGKKISSKTVAVDNGKSVSMVIKVKYGSTLKTYSLTIKRAKSKNNLLSSLKVSKGSLSPAFNALVTDYTLVLPKGTSKVTITAKAASALASVSPSKKIYTIKKGETRTVTVKVKAQSGAVRTYKIKILRNG